MTDVPLLTLNNGVQIPALGFGVFQTPPEETIAAVSAALATGYRHIDTAAAYGNEREVGEAIRRSGVDRSEVFVETKIWISDYGYDQTLHSFDKSAGKLGIDRIDLLILHQALPGEFALTVDAYRALEKLLADGVVRAIGVSNFMPDHLTRLLGETSVVPAVNQIEVHPLLPPVRAARGRRRARHPVAGVVADRGHHLLPRRLSWQHPAGPDHRQDRGRARQDARPGDAALAPPAGTPGHPEVASLPRGSRRTSMSSPSRSPRTSSMRSTPSTPACAVVRPRRRSPGRPSAVRFPRLEEHLTRLAQRRYVQK